MLLFTWYFLHRQKIRTLAGCHLSVRAEEQQTSPQKWQEIVQRLEKLHIQHHRCKRSEIITIHKSIFFEITQECFNHTFINIITNNIQTNNIIQTYIYKRCYIITHIFKTDHTIAIIYMCFIFQRRLKNWIEYFVTEN